MGGDLVTDQGIASAASSVARSGGAGEAFAAIGGGKLKHRTGSSVDISGTTLVAGVAAGVGNGATVGGFIEYGDGDYDSHNSFSRGKVKGSGNVEFVGVGFLGRLDLPKTASGQPYLEATARFGRVESDFRTDDFLDAGGERAGRAKYDDVKSSYHGLSFGGGHVWNIGANGALLDLYGRYVWTHQAGDSVNLESRYGGNEKVKFSAVDSHRTRVGVRYSTVWNGANRFYTGVAWEHEFDSKASAKVAGAGKIDSPDMKGSTGVAEFGLVFNPADNKNLSIDLGVQAYGGKRSGATGSAQLKYTF
jgi:outer membrane autotransporter protein